MSVKMIEQAKQKLATAEKRLQELEEEEARVRDDVAGWRDFILRAEGLAISTNGNSAKVVSDEQDAGDSPPNGSEAGKVQVKKDSLAGLSARLILDNGPLRLKELVVHLTEIYKDAGIKDFPTALNTAIWRRREDLFIKDETKRYSLRTKEIQFVD